MLRFRQFITEAKSSGVDFEWAIVYEALKESGMSETELLDRNPKLVNRTGKISADAKKALRNVPAHLWKTAKHSDESSIIGQQVQGFPEPKTDIIFGENNEYRVSVKMSGAIQLASGEGISSAKMLNMVMSEYVAESGGISDAGMSAIISRIETMPKKAISPQNISRIKKERPDLFSVMIGNDGKINPEFDWKKWEAENKEEIKMFLKEYTINHPKFLFILVDEALTGKRTFGKNNLATANYIITPNKFVEIDENYVNEVSKKTKIDLRAKSRKGITSAALRFDYRTEETNINESLWKKLKNISSKLKNSFSNMFKGLYRKLFSVSDIDGKINL
jgi:hypothetical protein